MPVFDYRQTVISQYGSSTVIGRLIASMNDALRQDLNFDAFYQDVWDITTAVGFGLDIWGRIVGLPSGRYITVLPDTDFFGFQDGSAESYQPFNQGVFYLRGDVLPGTSTVALTDTAFRTLILVKALANISDCSVPSLNRLITALFAGRGRCYVEDLGNMEMQYTFEFALMAFEKSILLNSGALPRPTGVGITVVSP